MSTERPLPNTPATGIVKALELKGRLATLESLLREAGVLITHAGEIHRPTTPSGGGGTTDSELLVSGEYLTRRKAWLERAVNELGPEWVEKRNVSGEVRK